MLSWISHWLASTRVPGSHTDRPLRPNGARSERVRVQHRTGPQVDGVLRDVVDGSRREREHGVGVEGDAVGRSAVHGAVGEMGRRRPRLCTPVPLISYTSQPIASRPLPSPVSSGRRPPVGAPGSAPGRMRATADGDRLTGGGATSHSSNTPPAPPARRMPRPAGWRWCRSAHGGIARVGPDLRRDGCPGCRSVRRRAGRDGSRSRRRTAGSERSGPRPPGEGQSRRRRG